MSGFSTTPNFGLKKPSTGADDGLWGTHWNQNADMLDATLKAHGDAISGLGTGGVTSWNTRVGAVVLTNADVTAVLPPSSTTPTMDGTAAIGVGTTWARSDHVHPSDTTRQTAAQVQAAVAPALNNVGRNLIHNSLFNVAQRGAGPFTTNGFTADRWNNTFSNGSSSVSIDPISTGNAIVIGDEAAERQLSDTFVGGAGANDFAALIQRLEDVRRLSGKTITVSFWATAGSTLKLGVNISQTFGTGGSPSAAVNVNGQSVTLTTTWTRYSLTFAVPSVSGKAFGTTAGTDYTQLAIWLSAGTTNSLNAGSVGVQSGSIALWGVQLEIGSVATPLEKPDQQQDLAKCQRFCSPGLILWGGYCTAGFPYYASTALPAMRAQPTLTVSSDTSTDFGTRTLAALGANAYVSASATASGGGTLNVSFLASADL